MPQLTCSFDPAIGPVLAIEIATPASSPQVPPAKRVVRLLIDSGASRSMITSAIATELGLPVLGVKGVRSTKHKGAVKEYLGDVTLPLSPRPVHFKDIKFLEFSTARPKFDGLLGRDLLRLGIFSMNGNAEIFTIAF